MSKALVFQIIKFDRYVPFKILRFKCRHAHSYIEGRGMVPVQDDGTVVGYIDVKALDVSVGAEEVQAACICIVYLCVPVCCVIEGGGGASSTLVFESTQLSNFDCEK